MNCYEVLAKDKPPVMMELSQSISIEDRMSGLFATVPQPVVEWGLPCNAI
jgi:hypothetical protein